MRKQFPTKRINSNPKKFTVTIFQFKNFVLLTLLLLPYGIYSESKYESYISNQIHNSIKGIIEECLDHNILMKPGYSNTLSIHNGWRQVSKELFFGVFDYKLTFYIAENKSSLFFPYKRKIINHLRNKKLDDGSFNGSYVFLGRAYFRNRRGVLSLINVHDFQRIRGRILTPQQISEYNKEEEITTDDLIEEVNGTPFSGVKIDSFHIPEYKSILVENLQVFVEGAGKVVKIKNNHRFKIRLTGLFRSKKEDIEKITLKPIFKELKTGITRSDIIINDIKRIKNIEKIDRYGFEHIRFKTNKTFDFVIYSESLETFNFDEKLQLTIAIWANGKMVDPIIVNLPVEKKSYWFYFLFLFCIIAGVFGFFHHYKRKEFNHTKYRFQLIMESGELEGKIFTLIGNNHIIGRIQKNQYSIKLDSDKVSRKHAVVKRVDRGYSITDENSTNGTFINDNKLKPNKPHLLQNGEKVRIGDVDFRMSIIKK